MIGLTASITSLGNWDHPARQTMEYLSMRGVPVVADCVPIGVADGGVWR